MESARLIAGLVRMVRDVALAEDLAQDALVAALSQWPESGVPSNPGAWLMAIAKRRAVDHFRRAERLERKQAELGHELELDQESLMPDFDAALEDQIEDDMLRLMFICCHPVLPTEARVALTLRLRQASRSAARVGPSGEPILLLDQNRARWDQLLIRRGLKALDRAESLGKTPGPYVLQAAIAACHARARTPGATDWARIAALYYALSSLAPSPVVELNRAVALGMAYGPQSGLELVDQLVAMPSLKDYHLLPSVRGDLLAKLGRVDEARTEFERAASLTQNERERTLLLDRARACR
jgi:predicted RNA polymerase sigma factor